MKKEDDFQSLGIEANRLENYLKSYLQNFQKQKIYEIIVVAKLLYSFPFEIGSLLIKISEAEARAKEKKRIMGELAHNIKGLISKAIVAPLQLTIEDEKYNNEKIQTAFRGAKLLHRIANAINLSDSGKRELFIHDIENPGDDYWTLKSIFEAGLKTAFANMFDSTFHNKYYSIHFPTTDRYNKLIDEFYRIGDGDLMGLINFGKSYMIKKINWNCDEEILNVKIGDTYNSALKLIILFQELFLNAVKNTTLISENKRSLDISMIRAKTGIKVMIKNSFNPNKEISDTNMGNIIIDNFLKQFSPNENEVKKEDGYFRREFTLSGFGGFNERL